MVLLESLLSSMVLILRASINFFILFFFALQPSNNLNVGRGLAELALADRATIANMAQEYGATAGFFPVDHISLEYLKMTGRNDETVSIMLYFYSVTMQHLLHNLVQWRCTNRYFDCCADSY